MNAVAPQSTEMLPTDALWRADPARWQRLHGSIAVGRVGMADAIAAGIACLAGENVGFVTGTALAVGGGLTSVLLLGVRPQPQRSLPLRKDRQHRHL